MERKITYTQALKEAIVEEMQRDNRVFIMGEDIGVWGGLFGVTKGLLQEFGSERVRDTPISEAGFVGCAVGAAIAGMHPIVEVMYIDFIPIAMDQIINHAAKVSFITNGKVKVPLVVRTCAGIGWRNACTHSQSLESLFLNIPGLVVAMPSTPYSAKGLLKTAIRYDGPVIFIEHKMLYPMVGNVPQDEYLIPFGEAKILCEGGDISIIATSLMVHKALNAAKELKGKGVNAEVIDPQTLVPLDEKTIVNSVKKTGRCIVVHEAPKTGGWAGEVIATIMEKALVSLKAPLKRVTGLDAPIPYGKYAEIQVVPQEKSIVQAALELVKF
jgi:pyruvate dehydrogenase E1 component beta subunit